jgi:hypothetical protein
MNTNYDELIPKRILFSIKEINDLGIIKSDMCKKLLSNRELEVIKLGKKNFILRSEIIRYLEDNTIAINEFEDRKLVSA